MWVNPVATLSKLRPRIALVVALAAVSVAEVVSHSEPSAAQPPEDQGKGKLLLKSDFKAGQADGWSLLKTGGAEGLLKADSIVVSGSGGSNALLLVVTNLGVRCGAISPSSIEVRSNQWYDLTFRARTEKRENDRGYGLTVSLESRDGKQVCARTTIPEVGGEWREYTVALDSRLAYSKAVLVISMSEPGAIWFDDISLWQRQTDREKRP